MNADDPGKDPVAKKPPTCYDCIMHGVCKYNVAALGQRFPFKEDAAIGPYLKAINEAQAEACAYFKITKE